MILEPLEIPEELLEAQEQGRLVVFAGAGVSRGAPSDLPDFKGLAVEVARDTRFEKELSRYETKLDRYFGEMSRGGVDVQQLVRQRIGVATSKPTDLHRWILDLFFNPKDIRIVTTNFDQHFTNVRDEQKMNFDQFFAPALPLGRTFRGLVYLHGSLIRDDEPLILSDEDFGRAYMTDGWARDFLRGMFDTYTTLFIGYSHTDPPVEYLARGMSSIRVAPRFALTSKGEEDWWNSLKVTPITFEKPGGGADFSQLTQGLHSWAKFSKQQPTETAERVRDILLSPAEVKPVKSQSSLLVRCIGRKDSCHFFTSVAKGWHWVEWADEQDLLQSLFSATTQDVSEAQWQLSGWLAKMLLAEQSDKSFLLIAQHGGGLGRQLWLALCRSLWANETINISIPLLQKWMWVLVSSCVPQDRNQLGFLLGRVAKTAPQTLGLDLFRLLTNVRVVVSKGTEFDIEQMGSEQTVVTRPRAEFNVILIGETYHLEQAWETAFKPLIPELGNVFLRILEDRLREMFSILRAGGSADDRHDPWSVRGNIRDRDAYRSDRGDSLVVDCLLDVVESTSKECGGLAVGLIEEWLSSDCPTLVRIGLLALSLSKVLSSKEKMKLLLDCQALYPSAFGATHEVKLLLSEIYLDLTSDQRGELWKRIAAGPSYSAPDGVQPEAWAEHCQSQIDQLTAWLAARNKECPFAVDALQKLKERSPEFGGDYVVDRITARGGLVERGQSPKSAAELLSQDIESEIDFLLTYKDEERPSGVTRSGLVAAVGEACAQNTQWAISLFEELDRRREWASDLWEGAFWRLKLSDVPADKMTWLLGVLAQHFATSHLLKSLTFFLFNGVEFSKEKAPSEVMLQALIRISIHIWQQIRTAEPNRTEEFEQTEWTTRAINHAAGHITEFWLKSWSFLRSKATDAGSGWPEWMQAPLEDMVKGESYAGQLGRVILGNSMPFVHAIDASWVRARLYPKFMFTQEGEAAFLLWEPHLLYGRLSRDLIIEMPPLYRQAFARFKSARNDLMINFYKHISVIVCSCLVDVNQDGWFKEFLLGLSEEQRASWANQMEFVLRGLPDERKQIIWDNWMKDYWQGRLHGKPCPVASKEAGKMTEWAIDMAPVFGSAVELVIQGPAIEKRTADLLYQLEHRPTLLATEPLAVIKLLKWLLLNSHDDWLYGEDVKTLVMQMPKKKKFVPDLLFICEQLARSGYTNAVDMKGEVQRLFVEES